MTSEWVSIFVDGQDMRVYLAQPETTGKAPGVLVIMEAFRVDKHIQEVTDELAREGYVAAAPVLYHRLGSNPRVQPPGRRCRGAHRSHGGPPGCRTGDEVRRVEAELNAHGKVCDIKIYPGADHGFNCDERPSDHAEAAQDAWGRTLGWFQRYLKA